MMEDKGEWELEGSGRENYGMVWGDDKVEGYRGSG